MKRKHHEHEKNGIYVLNLIWTSAVPVTSPGLCKGMSWSAVSKAAPRSSKASIETSPVSEALRRSWRTLIMVQNLNKTGQSDCSFARVLGTNLHHLSQEL